MKLISSSGNSKIGRNDLCGCGSGKKYKKCCLSNETELSAVPEMDSINFNMDSIMGNIRDLIESGEIPIDELNEHLAGKTEGEISQMAHALPRSLEDKAQDLIYEAWDLGSPKKMILAAQKALEMDPDCVDAHLMLGDLLAKDPINDLNYIEKAVASGERKLGKKFFEETIGHFWGFTETRPYMRALQAKIIALWEMRRQSEAIKLAWRMLELNPNDNQGIRYMLFDWLLIDARMSEVPKLLKGYKDDPTAHWQYNKLLYYCQKFKAGSKKIKDQVSEALESNPYVPDYLTGKKKLPKELADSYIMGSQDEAIGYVQGAGEAWLVARIDVAAIFPSKPKLVSKKPKKGR